MRALTSKYLSAILVFAIPNSTSALEALSLQMHAAFGTAAVTMPNTGRLDTVDERPTESVEVDVSTRSVAVTSSFTGVEIVAFGSVDGSRQTSPESGYYDVVIVFSGAESSATIRRKSNVAGVWINTDAVKFNGVPTYYAIASSRILGEITNEKTLNEHGIGPQYLKLSPVQYKSQSAADASAEDYRAALIKLKMRNGLFVNSDFGVTFVGRSLFRATIRLPANVPIGPLTATTYLFHNGVLLHSHAAHLTLERQGYERLVYGFALSYPFLYGVASVITAILAGIGASALFQRSAR